MDETMSHSKWQIRQMSHVMPGPCKKALATTHATERASSLRKQVIRGASETTKEKADKVGFCYCNHQIML